MGEAPKTDLHDEPAGPDAGGPTSEVETSHEDGGWDDGTPDGTLGGYLSVHDRPPAFEGSDGQPYTVSIEVESVGNLLAPYVVYLVFPRWAETGLGVVGHVETPILAEGKTREEVLGRAEELSLEEVKRLLDEAIHERMRSTEST